MSPACLEPVAYRGTFLEAGKMVGAIGFESERQCKYNAVSEPELPPETECARVARFSCRLCRTLAEEIGDTFSDHAAHHRSLRRS
jgi:hypothetical protein